MKLKTLLFLSLLLTTFWACKFSEATPEFNYPETTLVNVLTDLYFADAALKDIMPELQDSLRSVYRQQISVIHKVDLSLIEEDVESMQSNVKMYKAIHSIVQDSIALKEKNYSGKKKKEVKIKK